MTTAIAGARLVPKPVFILSPIRSGSTLLRCILDTHTAVHAPHELHLRYLTVGVASEYTDLALKTLGLGHDELRHLLWDRLLHAQLAASRKHVLVDKSPSNLWIHTELRACWPQAKFMFLRRHPADIVQSIVDADDGRDHNTAAGYLANAIEALETARASDPHAHLVRYEDLVTDPGTASRQLCDFLDIPYEPSMLDYGTVEHGPLIYGIGDWGSQIASGGIQPLQKTPHKPQSARIADLCSRWDYEQPRD